ncbi:MAG TPA: 2-oxoacid:acceptor oxidoreductase subunit alpha [Steroidobacteraceae bacterium]|nr:2-oxoacid:acceptor oxidoreductase subunit alpha [Steroidobacteraceae bacterium]
MLGKTAVAEATGVSVAMVGSGGAGVLTTGEMLLEAACAAGWNGLLTRSVGAQIRGGEAAALLRLASRPVECLADQFDLLVGIDWVNAQRFEAEIPLGPESIVVSDPHAGPPPAAIAAGAARVIELPLTDLTKTNSAWRANMIALGAAARLLGLDEDVLRGLIEKRFAAKGEAAVRANVGAVEAGARAMASEACSIGLAPARKTGAKRWLITGNEAVGLGALRGGVRFAAAYPITPASEILEWLAPHLAKLGGALVQAEDELASINMIIGASYGGVPSLTATSGPGLSLMTEALGLATAAEVPIVVVDVMRGGPSTGIPTKSEQADLNIAVYGLHGDAPHIVIAPQSVPDCLLATQWATFLAETLQAPAIVLSDQFLGQTQVAVSRPADVAFIGQRLKAIEFGTPYKRYALGGSAVSPMAIPGTRGGQYTADGLTHTERGIPTSSARDHGAQLDKRRDKLELHAYGDLWATLEGEGDVAVLTWGSLTGVVREAIALARADGLDVRLIAPRLLLPTRPTEMANALAGVKRLLVVEQSHGAQFHKYLRAHYTLPSDTSVLHRPGPLPMRPGEIHRLLSRGGAP